MTQSSGLSGWRGVLLTAVAVGVLLARGHAGLAQEVRGVTREAEDRYRLQEGFEARKLSESTARVFGAAGAEGEFECKCASTRGGGCFIQIVGNSLYCVNGRCTGTCRFSVKSGKAVKE